MFRELALQKGCESEEGHLLAAHVHMLMRIPPKYAVSQVVGYLKGKSAIHIARTYGGKPDQAVKELLVVPPTIVPVGNAGQAAEVSSSSRVILPRFVAVSSATPDSSPPGMRSG
jgi:hypothetical protein